MIAAKLTFLLTLLTTGLGGTSLGLHGGIFHAGIQHGGAYGGIPGGGIHHGGVHHGEIHHGGVIHGGPVYHDVYHNAPAHYNFAYGVQDDFSGTNFGHSESRDGYKTEGKYFVNLPDGRIQTVKYYADEHGYHPEVSYEGVARYHLPGPGYGGYH
nr:pro-resilin-like [Procambarus clarkii]